MPAPALSHDMAPHEAGAAALQAQLQGLHDGLSHLFALRRQAQARSRTWVHRQLLLGLELMWQIEEQVVLPVLHDGVTAAVAGEVRQSIDELSLMRDLALLATRTNNKNRDIALAVLEGMSMLHYVRLVRLLGDAPPGAADWRALENEVRSLLRRWRGPAVAPARIENELEHREDTYEDEDNDLVGQPPQPPH
jgi:hypothetical protein